MAKQVLEGALAATKSKMEQFEGEKEVLESRVHRLTADFEAAQAAAQSREAEQPVAPIEESSQQIAGLPSDASDALRTELKQVEVGF